MKINLISTKEILDYEKEIGIELVVTERAIHAGSAAGLSRYFVCFGGGDVAENSMLVGVTGNGDTIDKAITDYCHQISNKKMVFGANTTKRKEIQLPKLIHTKYLNQ